MPLKIILLRGDGPHHIYLERLLAANFSLSAVIEEPHSAQIRRLLRQRKWNAWLWSVYHKWRRILTGNATFRKKFFSRAIDDTPETHPVRVDWINDSEAVSLIRETPSDVIIVIGTSILSKKTLNATLSPIINIHGGWLPEYRGNHCYFFAHLRGDWEAIGSTIHYVDSGIDTGRIIDRVRPGVNPEIHDAEYLYCAGELEAIRRLLEILKRFESGKAPAGLPQPFGLGHCYYTKDRRPKHEFAALWRKAVGRLSTFSKKT